MSGGSLTNGFLAFCTGEYGELARAIPALESPQCSPIEGIGLPVGLANWVWDWSTDFVVEWVAAGLRQFDVRLDSIDRASQPAFAVRPALGVPARRLGEHETLALPVVPAAQPTS